MGEIARLSNDDDEMPSQRLALEICDERVKEIVFVVGCRSGACRLERLLGRQQPAYRDGIARRIDEAKRMQSVVRAVAEPG